jgi:hypothetical protein
MNKKTKKKEKQNGELSHSSLPKKRREKNKTLISSYFVFVFVVEKIERLGRGINQRE